MIFQRERIVTCDFFFILGEWEVSQASKGCNQIWKIRRFLAMPSLLSGPRSSYTNRLPAILRVFLCDFSQGILLHTFFYPMPFGNVGILFGIHV